MQTPAQTSAGTAAAGANRWRSPVWAPGKAPRRKPTVTVLWHGRRNAR